MAQVTVAPGGGGTAITDATASAGDVLNGKIAYNNSGSFVGTIVGRTSNGLVISGSKATLSSGYYSSSFSKNVAAGTISATYTSEALTANYMTQFTISPTVVASGWVSQAGANTQSFILSTADFTAGTITISENGTHDVAQYSSAYVNVAGAGGGLSFFSDTSKFAMAMSGTTYKILKITGIDHTPSEWLLVRQTYTAATSAAVVLAYFNSAMNSSLCFYRFSNASLA
jgi:hypothetical protein